MGILSILAWRQGRRLKGGRLGTNPLPPPQKPKTKKKHVFAGSRGITRYYSGLRGIYIFFGKRALLSKTVRNIARRLNAKIRWRVLASKLFSHQLVAVLLYSVFCVWTLDRQASVSRVTEKTNK
uniref:Uncharacterized protein n=1 Tax=Cacopsylla melanoneura TaxID=428564 RepID=A0A8D9BED2_9HEMI